MIRVTVELLPKGDQNSLETIAHLDVVNTLEPGTREGTWRYSVDASGAVDFTSGGVIHDPADGWSPLVRAALESLEKP